MAAAALARRSLRFLAVRSSSARSFLSATDAGEFQDRDRDHDQDLPEVVASDENVERKSWPGMQWVFLGCPGVGKGTYASRLALGLRVPHVAMGDLVRQELKRDSPLSKELRDLVSRGKLLPDELVLGLLTKRLEEASANQEVGFILDGFPRTASQAKTLDTIASIGLVVNLRLREDVLIAKCLGRRICGKCHSNYNIASVDVPETATSPRIVMPALMPPPHCLDRMTTRSDDTEDVIRERVRLYAEKSKPVEDYYRAQGKLIDFDILGGIPETWPRLLTALNLQDKIVNPSILTRNKQLAA